MKSRTLVLGVALVGCTTGIWMGARTAQARSNDVNDFLRTFSQIIDVVETKYVDEVDSADLIHGAIRGMLRTLDPHSSFLDSRSYKEMREEQRGSFSGLGIVISLRGDERLLTVISPIAGTPADRAGIRAGDVIAEIEGDETLGMGIDDALVRLRGLKGTQVSIKIRREGEIELFPFTITRDDIPTNSIQYAYMLQPGVGYIRIKNFTQTTDRELREKLEQLSDEGMEKLLLDLRWNPGGLLDQAVKVSSEFLGKGDRVVFTHGRTPRSEEEHFASTEGAWGEMPMVVLINRGSASASEIVAGAIQDHDRGVVVGETSWGKGLVQTVYSLSQNSAVALTTARYYTPSGRLIQRDYKSLEDYFSPVSDDEDPLASKDPESQLEVFYTDVGRKVFGGGGIRPDVIIKPEELPDLAETLERRSWFFEFARLYRAAHQESPDLEKFKVRPALVQEFRDFLTGTKELEFTDEEFEESADYIRRALKAEILGNFHGLEVRNRVLAEGDRQIQEALKYFNEAKRMARLRANLQDKADRASAVTN
ncbi:MAG: S41 family peptidase [Acidobacteria bacterium]|nr:MAG: S41 family peptidase [Acidobacteriota bacterium]